MRQLAAAQEHHRAGRLKEAERAYRDVLRRDRENPPALQLLGIIAAQTGRFTTAIDYFSRALARAPNNGELHYNLAEAYRRTNDSERAYESFARAISLGVNFIEAYESCAAAARQAAGAAASADNIDQVHRWNRRAAEQLAAAGRLYAAGRVAAKAEPAFREALELDPENATIFSAYGDLLAQMGRLSEAEPLYRKVLLLDPQSAHAYNNLGSLLKELGRADEAEDACRRAHAIDPNLMEPAYALSSGKLAALNYRADASAEEIFEAHRRWGDELTARQTEAVDDFPNEPNPDRRLRVGYVSPDLRQHASNSYFMPLLAEHDRRVVETFLYAEVAQPDAMSARMKSIAAHWRSTVGLSDAALRQRVRDDGIDILVDLAGHTDHTRIAAFAVKPAPVTVTWLGYPNTTGLPIVDYRLTDALADPPGVADHLHTEALVRLPHCFLCYQPPADAPEVAPTPALSRGAVTFGSFNNLAKVTPEVIETWAAILRLVPDSRLLLKGWILADPVLRQRMVDRFATLGVAADRLDLRRLIPGIGQHMALYREIDIGLDPFPYNGTTTTCEALWMGVPVVSIVGGRHAARVGLSLLSCVGLQHLVAQNRESYVAIAVGLAADAAALEAMRQSMRSRLRTSPLMDGPRFARDVESAYRAMWRSWCTRRAERE